MLISVKLKSDSQGISEYLNMEYQYIVNKFGSFKL